MLEHHPLILNWSSFKLVIASRLSFLLIWLNENINHFAIHFSDDGAPETSDLSMSIEFITVWNFGDKVRSKDDQYFFIV